MSDPQREKPSQHGLMIAAGVCFGIGVMFALMPQEHPQFYVTVFAAIYFGAALYCVLRCLTSDR